MEVKWLIHMYIEKQWLHKTQDKIWLPNTVCKQAYDVKHWARPKKIFKHFITKDCYGIVTRLF